MRVYIKVFASLRKKYPEINDLNPMEKDLQKGTTLADIVTLLDFKPEDIKIALVNGLKKNLDFRIEEEDTIISLFPPVGGG
ncbi:MAG: MoaD/ThiS family protein [Candidatus Heimdallarchaeota archaeon]|nr:MoaD/ThiS family protein [Candidatus Heimdallarchaeota archaeon]